MQLYIWRHFQIQVPDHWEMLFYGKNAQAGKCTFADRYQHRLEFTWSVVPGKPDFTRMLDDYLAEFRRDDEVTEVAKIILGAWSGFTARLGEVLTSRVGRFFPQDRCLVELVFLWPEQRDVQLERRVMESVREESLTPEGNWRWRAFGMDLYASAECELDQCTVQAGLARMTFASMKQRQRVEIFERMGLVSQWLHRPVQEWLTLRRPLGVTVRQDVLETAQEMEVSHLIGDQLAEGWRRLLFKRTSFDSRAWMNKHDGRLYCQTITGSTVPVTRRLFGWEEC